jgi:hypothetical protein
MFAVTDGSSHKRSGRNRGKRVEGSSAEELGESKAKERRERRTGTEVFREHPNQRIPMSVTGKKWKDDYEGNVSPGVTASEGATSGAPGI